jgi:glutamyl-tRNA reductase
MKIVTAGLNHKTAAVEVREKLAFDRQQCIDALQQLKNNHPLAEFVLLSTCNRIELYSVSRAAGGIDLERTADFFAEFHDIRRDDFLDLMYVHRNEDAVRHLLTVASGLDSMVVGEEQILSQVKESYRLACDTKSTGKILNRLFHCAFATSKRVHCETGISDGRVSVAGVAVGLAKQLFADIPSAKTVVIGAGEMGQLLIKHLCHLGCCDITVVNRSFQHGRQSAERFAVKAEQWDRLSELLIEADIVIASAAAQNYLFDKSYVKKIMQQRLGKKLLIIDIAVPRNFEPDVEKIDNVKIYSIDQLCQTAQTNQKLRQEDISACTEIICRSSRAFMEWFGSRDIGPMIGRMKEQFDQISRNELERFFAGAGQDVSCRADLETAVERIVAKLLHCVIQNVDSIAKEKGPAEAARLVEDIMQQAEKISSQPACPEPMQRHIDPETVKS